MIMFQNTSNKAPYVFVPIEYLELAAGEEIKPYQPGLICSEWLELELIEPSEYN
jgi:hypothetical protein